MRIKLLLLVSFIVSAIQITAQNIDYIPLINPPASGSVHSIIYKAATEVLEKATPGKFIIPIVEEGYNKIIKGIVDESKRHIGTPYRSGCIGKGYFDCSGFMKFLFGHIGIKMNASSSEQYRQGKSVRYKDLKVGDLVFFKGSDYDSKRIGHVGMVVEVDEIFKSFKFIHATVSYGVMIDKYPDGGYYSARYVGARRIIFPVM
ncbi:MAG: C40 family peptidase [Bacteroidales bacterium]